MTCGIIAHEAKKLPDYFTIVKRAFSGLPDSLKPYTKTDTKYAYEFTHRFDGAVLDSSIYVATDIRGGTVQKLHITESAYIKDRQKIKLGSKQAVPLTGCISEETTANGFNDFYDEYMLARDNHMIGDMDYKAYFYSWVENPEYSLPGVFDERTREEIEIANIAKEQYDVDLTDGQVLWRRWKMRELQKRQEGIGLSTEQMFKQEYPLTIAEAFQSGAGNVFDIERLELMQPRKPLTADDIRYWAAENNIMQEYTNIALGLLTKGIRIWYMPRPGIEYVSGVDPSDGNGADFSVIDIWTRKPGDSGKIEQCAQFYVKLLPDDLARITKELCEFYNKAFVGVENNMLSAILFLKDIYDNYYFEVRIDERFQKRTKKIGWNTNVQTREKMIDDFLIHCDDDLLEINSAITLSEMRTFVRKGMASGAFKREHADGKHDDALFAAFIAIQMTLYRKPEARVFADKPAGW